MAVEKAQAQDPAQQPQFTIEKIYVKDLSLEVPNAPQVFLERESPKVDIQLGTLATPLE
jgi:preprotein translocase subunit SecB